jgi:hypothetical protein
VDSDIPNAFAFLYDEFSFIAITVPLIYAISEVCLLLSKSHQLAQLPGVSPSRADYNELHTVLFYILVSFVVGHEWTHHVHGHVSVSDSNDAVFPNEVLDTGCDGSIEITD